MSMYADEESDEGVVQMKRSNNEGVSSAETVEKRFKVHDHVTWNSEPGQVSGRIVAVHTKDVDYKGYLHRASADDPQ